MADLQYYLGRTSNEEKKQLLIEQHEELHFDNTIKCPCGRPRHYSMAFRCLYCGIYMCVNCAEIHFGKTRKQHDEEQAATRCPGDHQSLVGS